MESDTVAGLAFAADMHGAFEKRNDALVPDRQGVDGEAQTWPPVSISTTTRLPGGSEQEPAPGGGLRPVGP